MISDKSGMFLKDKEGAISAKNGAQNLEAHISLPLYDIEASADVIYISRLFRECMNRLNRTNEHKLMGLTTPFFFGHMFRS